MYPSTEQLAEVIKTAREQAAQTVNPEPLLSKPNNLALMKWYQNQIKWAEEQIAALEAQSGIESTCSPGCSACCRQMIWTARAEVDIIKTFMQRLPQEVIQAVYERSSRHAAVVAGEFGTAVMARMTFNDPETRRRYYALNIMCPLLDEHGRCTVYPVRPSNCWAFRSYGDPGECHENQAPPHALHYSDLESKVVLDNLYKVKKPRSEAALLSAALVESLRDLL